MTLTNEEKAKIYGFIEEAERTGRISDELMTLVPTAHFCPEWDFMLVYDDGGPEWDCCLCFGSDDE